MITNCKRWSELQQAIEESYAIFSSLSHPGVLQTVIISRLVSNNLQSQLYVSKFREPPPVLVTTNLERS